MGREEIPPGGGGGGVVVVKNGYWQDYLQIDDGDEFFKIHCESTIESG